MAQIEFKNITKKYHDVVALDDVSFKIDEAEFVFFVGPSGAGKSTLIQMLIKETDPDAGDVLFKGQSVLDIKKAEVADLRRQIGVVFQDFKLLSSKTVFENVAIALEVVNTDDQVIKNIVPNVLTMVGLSSKMFKYPHQLSGGEKQRVSIARALSHEPDVLIADEPTGMIDPLATEDILEILEKINSLGTTVIMSTHDQHIVNKLKKRVIRIENGSIKSDKKGGKYNG
jgi:cell division transport system ATP-binding protein